MPKVRKIGTPCAVTQSARLSRGVVGILVGSFAFSSMDNLWYAIPAGILATFLFMGAATGWCPTNLFSRRGPTVPTENTLGYVEARQNFHL
jgi:hypothetical protein